MSKQERSRRLTPDEKRTIIALHCRGFGPADIITTLRESISHLRPHIVRDTLKRNPELVAEVRAEIAAEKMIAETNKQIVQATNVALQEAIPQIVDAARRQFAARLPAMVAREVEALGVDQELLDAVRNDVRTAADASSYMRARMLRQQRQDSVFGVAPPTAEQGSQSASLHLHLSSAWTPRRVASADEKSDNPPDRPPDVRRPE